MSDRPRVVATTIGAAAFVFFGALVWYYELRTLEEGVDVGFKTADTAVLFHEIARLNNELDALKAESSRLNETNVGTPGLPNAPTTGSPPEANVTGNYVDNELEIVRLNNELDALKAESSRLNETNVGTPGLPNAPTTGSPPEESSYDGEEREDLRLRNHLHRSNHGKLEEVLGLDCPPGINCWTHGSKMCQKHNMLMCTTADITTLYFYNRAKRGYVQDQVQFYSSMSIVQSESRAIPFLEYFLRRIKWNEEATNFKYAHFTDKGQLQLTGKRPSQYSSDKVLCCPMDGPLLVPQPCTHVGIFSHSLALANLYNISRDAESLGLAYSLDAGSLLSAVRDQNIHCWEYDTEAIAELPQPKDFDKWKIMWKKGEAMGFKLHFTVATAGRQGPEALGKLGLYAMSYNRMDSQNGWDNLEVGFVFNFIASPPDEIAGTVESNRSTTPSILRMVEVLSDDDEVRWTYDAKEWETMKAKTHTVSMYGVEFSCIHNPVHVLRRKYGPSWCIEQTGCHAEMGGKDSACVKKEYNCSKLPPFEIDSEVVKQDDVDSLRSWKLFGHVGQVGSISGNAWN